MSLHRKYTSDLICLWVKVNFLVKKKKKKANTKTVCHSARGNDHMVI